jgi:hypothetical protein
MMRRLLHTAGQSLMDSHDIRSVTPAHRLTVPDWQIIDQPRLRIRMDGLLSFNQAVGVATLDETTSKMIIITTVASFKIKGQSLILQLHPESSPALSTCLLLLRLPPQLPTAIP